MKSLLISGISGKVGSFVYDYAHAFSFSVMCGVDKNDFTEANCPIYKSFDEVKENIDVIIDFSSPELTEKAVEFAIENKVALVCGTTALTEKTKEKLRELSLIRPVTVCNNFSKGFATFTDSVKKLNNSLKDFDVEICETHNKTKKDAPSGSAIVLAKQVDCIKIHSLRGGNPAGVHSVYFLGNGEEITVTHRVYDKSVFAVGALQTANYILTRKSGLIDFDEVLRT